jgi:hypothetical protein
MAAEWPQAKGRRFLGHAAPSVQHQNVILRAIAAQQNDIYNLVTAPRRGAKRI